MIKENDKDAIIQHLLETLDKVDDMLGSLSLGDYNFSCDICDYSLICSEKFDAEINKLRDYIWHRKTDVTF